jgi:hypothetical protein
VIVRFLTFLPTFPLPLTNPGFSSTTGVQIAMTRFNQVVVDKTASLVEVGAGLGNPPACVDVRASSSTSFNFH